MAESGDFENPFQKLLAEDLNGDLLKYFFATPKGGIYEKLTSRTHLKLIGGWGSGKTTLLQHVDTVKQIQAKNFSHLQKLDFVGVYIKATTNSFNSFVKAGGEFKSDGPLLFGHFFNLLILEKSINAIIKEYESKIIKITQSEQESISKIILSKLSFVNKEDKEHLQKSGFGDWYELLDFLGECRRSISTMIDTRDLPQDISYKKVLRLEPTNNESLLEEIFEEIISKIKVLNGKRFYVLLDECESLYECQQKVVNSIIKTRPQTMVFKLATRPPDIKTMETSNETSGLTDREISSINLDRLYDSKSSAYRKLCIDVATNRLKKYNYSVTDITKILGEFTIEDEIGKEKLKKYLRKNYPNKKRLQIEFEMVYRDFKNSAGFQIHRQERTQKKYAGFDTYASLSSGIMVQFIDLCRETFELSKKNIKKKNGKMVFSKLPIPIETQNSAVKETSMNFFNEKIPNRARSLRDTPVDMEFGEKIQHVIRSLTGLFRTRLMKFNEPESTRMELPEGISGLDNSLKNPVQQIFRRAIEISVFQEIDPYEAKNVGGIKPPTYTLNKILCVYPENLSPKPRWRTIIHADVFNMILGSNSQAFQNKVLKGSKKKSSKTSRITKAAEEKGQLNLDIHEISGNMPLLSYLVKKVAKEDF